MMMPTSPTICGISPADITERAKIYTPTFTIDAACKYALTGVGASIAFGNQICIGNCADLPHAANITPNNTIVFALGSKCSNAVIEKVPDWLNK